MKEINFNYYEENASEFFESTVTADMVDLYTSFFIHGQSRRKDIGSGVRQWTGQQILHKTRIPGRGNGWFSGLVPPGF